MSVNLSYGVFYTCIAFLLDISGSMDDVLQGSDKSKYQMAIESLISILNQLRSRLNTKLIVFVYTYGNGGVKQVIPATLLCDIDTQKLPAMFDTPKGLTPMGECIVKSLEDMDAFMAEKKASGYQFTAPLLSLLTDGEATDDMAQANAKVDAKLGHKPRQQLVVIPVGIGKPTQFGKLLRLMEADPASNEVRVITQPQDFEQFVRLITGTTVLVNNRAASANQPIKAVGVNLFPMSTTFLT